MSVLKLCYVLALDASDSSLLSWLVKFPLMSVVLITNVNDNYAVPCKLRSYHQKYNPTFCSYFFTNLLLNS